jgi:hypothetical protein
MKAFHADRQPLALPPGHRFPATKYRRCASRRRGLGRSSTSATRSRRHDAILRARHDLHYVQAIAGNG